MKHNQFVNKRGGTQSLQVGSIPRPFGNSSIGKKLTISFVEKNGII